MMEQKFCDGYRLKNIFFIIGKVLNGMALIAIQLHCLVQDGLIQLPIAVKIENALDTYAAQI